MTTIGRRSTVNIVDVTVQGFVITTIARRQTAIMFCFLRTSLRHTTIAPRKTAGSTVVKVQDRVIGQLNVDKSLKLSISKHNSLAHDHIVFLNCETHMSKQNSVVKTTHARLRTVRQIHFEEQDLTEFDISKYQIYLPLRLRSYVNMRGVSFRESLVLSQ